MLIRTARASDVRSSEITPQEIYRNRRQFLTAGAAALGTMALGIGPARAALSTPPGKNTKLANITEGYRKLGPKDALNSYDDITHYNNFYEFGTAKDDPAAEAHRLKTRPWTVKVDGLCNKPGTIDIDDILKAAPLEERIYRHRCVEAWSMVMPWVGFSMSELIKRFEPQGSAKFVQFDTLVRPAEMIGQKRNALDWPYVEGLRMDEAMHPLTMVVVGLYGEVLPNQNGAPLRIHVPWKYGFKSGKSIVRISFTEKQPQNTWMLQAPSEYGFYANVNPNVDHPRWSQAREQRLPGFLRNTPTLMFNGYGEEVASLYTGMSLERNF